MDWLDFWYLGVFGCRRQKAGMQVDWSNMTLFTHSLLWIFFVVYLKIVYVMFMLVFSLFSY